MLTEVWINGEWRSVREAAVSVDDRNFLLGDGCFETIRFANGVMEGVDYHLNQLERSMRVLGISNSPGPRVLSDALTECADRLNHSAVTLAAARLTLSRGEGRGADGGGTPNIVVSVSPAPQRPLQPLQVKTSAIRRNETSPVSTIKATSYADNLNAFRDAKSKGADEALMLNTQGRIAGLSLGNLLIMREEEVITPPESEGVRPGYMREQVLSALKDGGLKIDIRPVEPAEILDANASLYGMNSLWGVRALAKLDGRTVSSHSRGEQLFGHLMV